MKYFDIVLDIKKKRPRLMGFECDRGEPLDMSIEAFDSTAKIVRVRITPEIFTLPPHPADPDA